VSEGGFRPFFELHVEGVELLPRGIEAAGCEPGDEITIALAIPPATSTRTIATASP
jgi:enolase